MADLGDLLARIGGGLFQQAYVVADLASAEHGMRASLGCSTFAELPATDLDYELRGRPVSCALAIGFARSGNSQIELIHPVRGEGLHIEFLAANGPGLHHLGFHVDDLDPLVGFGDQIGCPKVMGGRFGRLHFCYLDSWDALGVYAELVEDPDEMMMALMPWR